MAKKHNTRLKHKAPPLDLFSCCSQAFEDEVFLNFRGHALKLVAEGFGSTCEVWWRSRFYEHLYPNHHAPKNDDEWAHRNKAQTNWPLIWKRLKKEVLT